MMQQYKLLVNAKNSEFFFKELHFLDNVLSGKEIYLDPKKI